MRTVAARHRGRLGLASVASVLCAVPACGSSTTASSSAAADTLLVAINVPSSADPFIAGYIKRGAELAARELSRDGVVINGHRYTVTLRVYDDALDPQRATSNVSAAIHDGAVGIVEDGFGAALSASHSAAAGVPEIIISNGDAGLLNDHPSLFRLGIADDAAATVLGGYIAKKAQSVAIIHDDTAYGRDGADQLTKALATASATVPVNKEVPASAPAVDAELRAASDAHVAGLAVWGGDAFTARVVAAAHADGIGVPVFSGPAGESTTVRKVAGAAAAEGLVFAASRMASESDSASFGQFEHRLASAEGGPTDAGFKDAEGREIRQPADYDMFSYDAVRVLCAALQKSGSASPGSALLTAMTQASVTSANGDHRGFNPDNHEGVADDDIYVAVIHDMTFAPVRDESLSATLPVPDEILANFH
jgi:branched-chain amino acid transport system substrate-binding protein